MTKYYLQILVEGLSIEIDSDLHYHYHYHPGDIVEIYMYSDKGPKLRFGRHWEYDAIFTHHWDSPKSKKFTIAGAIVEGFVSDVTKMVGRGEKLAKLGI